MQQPLHRDLDVRPIKTWTLDDPELLQVVQRFVGRLRPAWFQRSSQEEMVQECFVKLGMLGDLPGGKQRTFCVAFLWRTVLFVRNDLARKEGRRLPEKNIEEEYQLFELESPLPESNPYRVTRSWEIGQAIRDCLSRLKADYRQAVVLRLGGFKIAEIAEILDLTTPRAAENKVLRGMTRLRSCLIAKGITP